jgi:hypothetical protein
VTGPAAGGPTGAIGLPVPGHAIPAAHSAEFFINNIKYGETNGCSGGLIASGEITCGHPGAVSWVTWEFIERRGDADHYIFTRTFPSDAPSSMITTHPVDYRGETITVFQDDVQRMILRPPAAASPPDPR